MQKKVVVVGGGASGIMASIMASLNGASVVLLEKKARLGIKLAMSGGGRCNFTNVSLLEDLILNIPGNGKFLYSAFQGFSGEDCREFFRKLGVASKEEERGRIFTRDGGEEFLRVLKEYLLKLKVKIYYNTEVDCLLWEDKFCLGVKAGKKDFYGKVIIATGGLSYPATGSNGAGYKLAKEVGHKITPCLPSGVGLLLEEDWWQEYPLKGLSLSKVSLNLSFSKPKKTILEEGELLFTHFGISGPLVLRVSRWVALYFAQNKGEEKKPLIAYLDLFPDISYEKLLSKLLKKGKETPNKSRGNLLKEILPNRLVEVALKKANLEDKIKVGKTSEQDFGRIALVLKKFGLKIVGTRPIKEAIVTVGGVSVREVCPKTMESKLVKGLFFAGEVLDVDGYTGGYNLQIAFATGFVAGKNASD